MQLLKLLTLYLGLFLSHTTLLLAQGFFPIDPQYVKIDTSSICKPGESELIVDGPMAGDDGLPIGGYVTNGIQKKNWVNPKDETGYFAQQNGIFGRTVLGQMVLIPFEELGKYHYIFEWAFQNGKILVLDGKNIQNPGDKEGMYSAIGFQIDGSLVIFQTLFEPTSPWELADEIIHFHSLCRNAIMLDFDSEYSSLWGPLVEYKLKPGKMKLHFKAYSYGIVVKKK